jgi:hypothetical protein
MLSAVVLQSIHLDISLSTKVHSALEIRRAETTASLTQLKAQLQAAPLEKFPENHDMVEQSAFEEADKAP